MGKLSAYHLSMGQIMQADNLLAAMFQTLRVERRMESSRYFGVKNAIESVEDVRSVMVLTYMGSPIYP